MMNRRFPPAAQSRLHSFARVGNKYIDSLKRSKKTRSFVTTRILHFFLLLLFCEISPTLSFCQLTGGAISTSSCQTYNAAHIIIQSSPISGEDGFQSITYTWERSTDNFATAPVTTGGNSTNLSDNYTLTGTTFYRRRVDNAGNTAYSNIVTINPNPNVTNITPATPDICFGQTSFPVTITALFNPDQYQILWTSGPIALTDVPFAPNNFPAGGGINVQVLSNAPIGTYTGTLTLKISSTGCTFTGVPASAVINPLPSASISGTTSVCTGASSPSITFTGSNGTAPYTFTYNINGGSSQTIATISGNSVTLPASTGTVGTFTYNLVSVQESSGSTCSNAAAGSAVVTVNPLPSATISGTTSVCTGSSSPSVIFTGNNGTAPYTFTYNINGGSSQTIATTSGNSVILPAPTGTAGIFTYNLVSVQESSGSNCSNTASGSAVITVNALPSANMSPSGSTTFCTGGSVTLTASTAIGYLWNTGETTASIGVSSTSTKTVTVTDANGCSATSAPTIVTVNPLPSSTITASGPTTFCTGGSVTLTAGAASAYLWNTGETTQSINVTSTSIETLRVTDANGCSATSAPVTVTVNSLPSAAITASGPITFCTGGSVTLTAGAASAYLWNTGETTASVNVSSTSTKTVTVTDANGCSATSAPVTVTVNSLPSVAITASGPITFCTGSSVALTAGAASAYLWNTGETTASVNVSSTSTKTVTVTDANGCSATSAPVTVTVNSLPSVAITASGPTTFCTGGSVTLTAGAANAYLWNTGETTASVNVTSTSTKTVTVTDANGCSATSAPVTITVNALPSATITASGPTTFCTGGSVTLTAGAANAYLWNTGETTASINVSSTSTKTVTVTDANGCSATSAPVTVTVNSLPSVAITASGPTTFCTGGSVTLTAGAANAYLWNTGETTASVNVSSTSTKTVTVTDANGCSATSAPITVTVNSLPSVAITASGPTTFCTGGSVTLTASSANGYLWNTGETSQSVNVSNTSTKTVTVTDANGCSATSAPITVTVNSLPSATIAASGPTTFCTGGSVTLTAGAASAYLWNTGETTASINVSSTSTKTVTVTDANGCSATSAPVTVTVNTLPSATIAASGPTTFCMGGSVTLTASSANGYLWNTGETTASVNVSSTSTKTVRITDANGCSATSAPVTVTVNTLPSATITANGPLTFCTGSAVTLTASAASAYLWNTGETSQSVNVSNTSTKTVTVTDANGCSATSTPITITVNSLPSATITASGPTTFCMGGSVTLTASAAISYVWNTGETTQSINATTAGNKTVTVKDANGCNASSSHIVITVNPLPAATIGPGATVCQGDVSPNVTFTGSNATPPYTFAYNINGGATQTINSSGTSVSLPVPTSVPGTFVYNIISVKEAGGSACANTASGSATFIVNPLPTVNIVTPTPVCFPGTVNLMSPAIVTGSSSDLLFTYWRDAAASITLTNVGLISATGTYYIKGTTAAGCFAVQPVLININPQPTVSITNPIATCFPATVNLLAPAVTAGSDAGLNFSYWTDSANTNVLANATAVGVSGTYYIRSTAVTGCFASKPVVVTINPLPGGVLQDVTVNYICENSSLQLNASGAYSYQWYVDNTIINSANAASYVATRAGNYTVQFISKEGCSKNAANAIALKLLIKPVLQFSTSSRCMQTPVSFSNNSTFDSSGTISWVWDFGDGTSSNTFSPVHIYTKSGTYTILLTASNASCPSLTSQTSLALLIEPPQANIRYDTVDAVNGKSVNLNARSFGKTYLWQPSTGLNNPATRSPIATLEKDIDYTVAITSSAGCITTDSVYVKLTGKGEIYLPQGFTPNNDGRNDRAYPILVGIRQLNYFKIFNRWGNLVFQTIDATPQNGWDGKYIGKMQPTGTYTWIAEGIDGNGNIVKRSGNILLIY